MDKTALVSVDVSKGMEIVETLERSQIKVKVALWAVLSEFEDWRLIISAPQFNVPDLRVAYGLLHDSLRPAGFGPRNTPPVMIFRTNDPFVRDLRRVFAKTKSVEGMRLGGQMFGDRFVEDAYVYRIS
jgi:hypothetical protein